MDKSRGCVLQIIVKWTSRAQGIFPLPSFCPTCYGLSNVMRRKGTRHAFIECRVTARECNGGVNGEEDAAEQ